MNSKVTAETISALYQQESRRVLATLIRLLGDFELAEEALQEAFASALQQWPVDGLPEQPRAWLVSTGRFKAIDKIRQQQTQRKYQQQWLFEQDEDSEAFQADEANHQNWQDDELRLIFTCCHPALSTEAQIALTLREICGLTTEQIAKAFLTNPVTIAQRIVRAKNKIRDAAIPYEIPVPEQLPERLDAVLKVIYLLFNEGYSQSSGDQLLCAELCAQAIRLGYLLLELQTDSETMGLLALLLLQESRRHARINQQGDLILLADQDRSLWDPTLIQQGVQLVERSLTGRRIGPYGLQAAIAALHAESPTAASTDWPQIVALYDVLYRFEASPVVLLNRAVAISMAQGPAVALPLLLALEQSGELSQYHLLDAALADIHHKLGLTQQARFYYQQALSKTSQQAEQRFLQKRLENLC
ncbi:RNA polymerase sigma factor, sigma-70 family [Rheinheimera sp. A13L]|uniref:RNA polymerase sigma factor n=1 Tax=Rheinheimera sp. A13L TaxID=506534 RepID=UPI00021251AC|nr:RNA polymerase sigma factor [Rheinheimera sp. A13L]EGM79077.1 RNA polymerase sigma factor, sigma-70 family [Rheinheimera sp. A13L]